MPAGGPGGPGGPGGGPITPPPGGIDPAPNPEANVARIKGELIERFNQRMGDKVLHATNVEISAEDMKTAARGLAIDKAENYMREARAAREAVRDEKLKKKADEKGIDFDVYKKKSEKGIVRKFINFIKETPHTVPMIINRAKKMNAYEKVAEEAMVKSGRYEAGILAIDHYMASGEGKDKRQDAIKNAVEDVKGFEDQNMFIERIQKKNAKEGDFANDEKVEIFEEGQESRKKAFQNLYANYMFEVTKAGNTDADNERVAEARKTLLGAINLINDRKKGTGQVNTYEKLAEEIDDKFRGTLKDEFESGNNTDEHKAGLAAIDEYIEKNLEVINGRVKTGLDMNEKKMINRSDKLIMSRGALLGTTLSLATGWLQSIPKIGVYRMVGLASTLLAVKMLVAGTFGYIGGRIQRNRGQRYEDARQAVGEDEWREGDKIHYRKTKVSNYVDTLNNMFDDDGELNSYKDADGKDVKYKTDDVCNMLADIYARKQVQRDKGIQLLSFDSRESIERQNYELIEATGKTKEKLIALLKGRGMDDAEDAVNHIISSKAKEIITGEKTSLFGDEAKTKTKTKEGLLNEIEANEKARKKDRKRSGRHKAEAAAIFAGIFDYLWHHKQINEEIGQAAQYFAPGLFGSAAGTGAMQGAENIVDSVNNMASDTTDTGGDTGNIVDSGNGGGDGSLDEVVDGTDSLDTTETLDTTGLEDVGEKIDYKPGAPVIIEDDPQGGVSVGFDNNGNGVLDEGEFLRGEGNDRGINLTSRVEYEAIRDELKDNYNLDLQREAIDVIKYDKIAVEDYLKSVNNAVDVKETVLSTGSYDITLGVPVADVNVDNMMQYVVNVGGDLPDDAMLFIDFDGSGTGKVLAFQIIDGQVIIPADVVNVTEVGNNGVAGFFGSATVGRMEGSKIISFMDPIKGTPLGTEPLTALTTESGYAFTVTDEQGETLSSFAVNTQGKNISNLSEIFNGIAAGESDRLPAGFSTLEGIEDHGTFASGEKVPDVGDYHGGYNPHYDSSINNAFKSNSNPSFIGTPDTWDSNGDGIMDQFEEVAYCRQQLVRTATNPWVLAQHASNYGMLEPDVLAKNLFDGDKDAMYAMLSSWGIDGVPDNEKEIQIFLDHLKMPKYSGYWDKLVNSTIHEMQDQLAGGGYEQGSMTTRMATAANKNVAFDTKACSSVRTVFYPYKTGPNGERIYVGNKGWWVRTYYGSEGGKVADIPLCEQKGVVPRKDENVGKEGAGKEVGDKESGQKEQGEKEQGAKEIGDKEQGQKEQGQKEQGAKEIGDKEQGEKEQGQKEQGAKEVGDKEQGQKEQGDKEQGAKEVGDKEQGQKEQGDKEQGAKEIGDKEQGDKEQGDKEQGAKEIGDKEQGEKEQGQKEQGAKEVGDKEVGDKEQGQKEQGDKEQGAKEVGDKEVGDKEQGQKEQGDKEQGAKEIGDKEQGEKEQGQKEQGAKEVGDKEVGDKEQGQKEQGDKEQGAKEIGDKEVGDKEQGEKEQGAKEVGDKEVGDKEIGEKEVGQKEGSMNSGDDSRPMGTSEDMDNMAIASDTNEATTGTPGSSMGGNTSETVYNDNMILDENGRPMTNPGGETYISTTGETEEEVLQNIQDGTQTTHSTGTTNYDPNATGSAAQDLEAAGSIPLDEDGNRPAGTGVITEEPVTSQGDPGSAAGNNTYTQEDIDNLYDNFF